MEVFIDIESFPEVLYHATSSNRVTELKSGISVIKGVKKADFGQGFYLTANLEQAKSWAARKGRNAAVNQKDPSIQGAILVYELDKSVIIDKKMNVRIFTKEDKQWAEFVFNNRTGETPRFIGNGEITDIVYGPLADGNTAVLVRKLQRKKISFREFSVRLKGHLYPFPIDHQFSFHTEKSLKGLRLIDVMEVQKYG